MLAQKQLHRKHRRHQVFQITCRACGLRFGNESIQICCRLRNVYKPLRYTAHRWLRNCILMIKKYFEPYTIYIIYQVFYSRCKDSDCSCKNQMTISCTQERRGSCLFSCSSVRVRVSDFPPYITSLSAIQSLLTRLRWGGLLLVLGLYNKIEKIVWYQLPRVSWMSHELYESIVLIYYSICPSDRISARNIEDCWKCISMSMLLVNINTYVNEGIYQSSHYLFFDIVIGLPWGIYILVMVSSF